MWPYLFGSGWLGGAVLSAVLVAAAVAGIAVLLAPRREPTGYAGAAADRIQTIWHAYEQGDLTEWEFARLITPRRAMYGRRAVSTGLAAHDAAAD